MAEKIQQLYDSTKIENAVEATAIILHNFMMETGFKSSAAVETGMPENWNRKGVCRIQYYHVRYPDVLCWMIAVPLGSIMAVHAVIDNVKLENALYTSLNINNFINKVQKFQDPFHIYKNVNELSRVFKDGFCFPLLASIQISEGYEPDFGFNGLYQDLKMEILQLLRACDLVAISGVNKELHNLANTPQLWKVLYHHDFNIDKLISAPENADEGSYWKDKYKEEYTRRKAIAYNRMLPIPDYFRHPFPRIFHDEDDSCDLSFDFDPDVQSAFPQLRHRFPPSRRLRPFLSNGPRFFSFR